MQTAAESTTSWRHQANNNTSVARRKDLPQLWIFGAKGRKMGDRPDKLGVRCIDRVSHVMHDVMCSVITTRGWDFP
jgi:hypothetical protein